MCKARLVRTLAVAITFAMLARVALAATPGEIVARADRVRNPETSFRTTSTLIAYRAGQAVDRNVFTVYSKLNEQTGQFRDIVIYAEPPRDAGKILLFSGRNLWFFDPASKDSVRISPQQQLIGQANAGDVLTVNLAADYRAVLAGTQMVEDADGKPQNCYHLELTPANEDAIYNRIEYWVQSERFEPLKAKFYADSGKLLKVLYYRDFRRNAGPAQAVILDAVDTTLVTMADFSKTQALDIPDVWFQRSYLPQIKP